LKIVAVFFFLEPLALACRLACFTAVGLGAISLMSGIAWIWTEQNTAVHAPALPDSCGHRPLTSGLNDHANPRHQEEDGSGRTPRKQKEEDFMRMLWKKTKEGKATFSG
jgi:hypothetical protein